MVNDQIADMLTRIKNGAMVHKESVEVPHSKMKLEIAKILKKEGYIENFSKKGKKTRKFIEVALKYGEDASSVINGVRRVSKPGRRLYTLAKNLKPVKQGLGKSIISTPKGLMTNLEARKNNIGGEILFEIW
jgi:small subunit ribosomal protein S8